MLEAILASYDYLAVRSCTKTVTLRVPPTGDSVINIKEPFNQRLRRLASELFPQMAFQFVSFSFAVDAEDTTCNTCPPLVDERVTDGTVAAGRRAETGYRSEMCGRETLYGWHRPAKYQRAYLVMDGEEDNG